MAKSKMRKFGTGGDIDSMDRDTEDTTDYAGGQDTPLAGTSSAEEAPAPRAKAIPKIVTKEELAKSGLSLRDYLNKQQGLTRRGEASAPAVAAPSRPSAPAPSVSTASRPGIMARMREADKGIKGLREAPVEAKTPAESRLTRGTFDASEIDPRTLLPRKRSSAASRYAAGGSVSSASRRGDGIATKGKTKGRYL